MLDFDLLKDCYGCGACVNVCPRGAVHMTQAADGSYIPEIDEARCIGCGRCDRVCIHQHADKNHTPLGKEGCYAAYQLDTQARKASASGGMFFPLAQEMLRQGGYVCGCVWNEQMDAVHIVSNKLEDVERMRSSKYVQSDIGNCLATVRGLLKAGTPVMFCGTPCQCAACAAVTGNPENLLLVALICEGAPTAGVWQRYRDAKAARYGEKIRNVNFRSKTPVGWTMPYFVLTTKSGKRHREMSYRQNPYVLAMLQGLTYRQSCYHCEFKGDNGSADIVVGDLWKAGERLIQQSENQGISALIINTQKGKDWVDKAASAWFMEEYPLERVCTNNSMLVRAGKENAHRAQFFSQLDATPIETNLNQYIVHENGIKLRVTQALVAVGLYKPLRNAVRKLRRR